jgi:hypothetical protein
MIYHIISESLRLQRKRIARIKNEKEELRRKLLSPAFMIAISKETRHKLFERWRELGGSG